MMLIIFDIARSFPIAPLAFNATNFGDRIVKPNSHIEPCWLSHLQCEIPEIKWVHLELDFAVCAVSACPTKLPLVYQGRAVTCCDLQNKF